MNQLDIGFILNSVYNKNDIWDLESQNILSSISFPDNLLGIRKDILKGDIYREWGRWFIEQFMDVNYFHRDITYPVVWSDVYTVLNTILGWESSNETKGKLTGVITKCIMNRLRDYNTNNSRKKINKNDKSFLLSLSGRTPRCWLTGLQFSDEAIDIFLEYSNKKPILPDYIDKFLPIGINEHNLLIEVDHTYPYSQGGDNDYDNYRLVCGWANRVKSAQVSIYMNGTGNYNHVSNGNNLQNHYWALRTIGLKRKCEHPGCKNNLTNSRLTISSFHGNNKLVNPLSMKVLCYEHAGADNRFIPRSELIY